MSDCRANWFRGCKYEARYDSEPSGPFKIDAVYSATAMNAVLNSFQKKTYVHDICVRCGKIIKRPSQ